MNWFIAKDDLQKMLNANDKVSILFVLPNFDTGGSEKLVMDLVQHLNKDIFNPAICAFFSGVYEQKAKDCDIPFYKIHERDRRSSKKEIVQKLNHIIREREIQVVNSHHTMTLMQGLPSFKFFNKVRVIHTEHTRLDYDPGVRPKDIALERFFLKFVDVALGISQGVCDYFQNELRVSPKKIEKILNGVDVQRFQFSNREEIRRAKRKEFNIADDTVVIGLCGNLRKQKNHALLIEAAAKLKQKKLKFCVLCAGTSVEEEVQALHQKVKDMQVQDCVHFIGARMDVPELMQAFDIYCLPSFFEGLPFSLMEAMAAGLPAVATRVEGNREVVQDGKTGFLTTNDNVEELTQALEKLIVDQKMRHQMGEAALVAVEELSFERMMQQYEKLFTRWR